MRMRPVADVVEHGHGRSASLCSRHVRCREKEAIDELRDT